MKRWIVVAVLAVMLVAALVGTALAQGTTPPTGTETCPCGLTPGTMPQGDGMRGGGMRGGGMPEWAGMDDVVEELLGLTTEQLQAERLAGKSLVQIAQAKGVSEAALTQAIMDDHKTDLAKLVSDGKLTQAQADAMLARMQDQVKLMVERTGVGPMWRSQPGQSQNVSPMMGGDRGSRGGMMGQRGAGIVR